MKELLTCLVIAVFLSGCTTTQKGGALGSLLGAGAGAVIGHQTGHRTEGAVIGAAAGGLGGAAVGSKIDTTKFCPSCGKHYKTRENYCPHDGTELKTINK